MALLITDCPRCGTKEMTFDVEAQHHLSTSLGKNRFEIFCVCRGCNTSTVFIVFVPDSMLAQARLLTVAGLVNYDHSLTPHVNIERFVSVRDKTPVKAPEHVEGELKNAFNEGAACFAIGCHNAAAAMFRLCLDLETRKWLPDERDNTVPQPSKNQRYKLGYRLPWLFEQGKLPAELENLADCIKEDGNDGAHVGNLNRQDVEDLLDFTSTFLERMISVPKRLEIAQQRRQERRKT